MPTEVLEVDGNLKVTGDIYGQRSWGFKKGPLSYVSSYINEWDASGDTGSSIDCTSSENGCFILKPGTYEIRCVQRASSTTSVYIGIGLNGDRSTLENRSDAVWNHDHSESPNQYTESNFMGALNAGDFITCGAPTTGHSDNLLYGPQSFRGTLTLRRID